MSKRLGGIIGCKDKAFHGIQTGSPMVVKLGQQQDNVGEKPTVILYTYINRHAGIILLLLDYVLYDILQLFSLLIHTFSVLSCN